MANTINIYGINCIYEAILNNRVLKIFTLESFKNEKILNLANKKSIEIEHKSKKELDFLSNNGVHQGIIAVAKKIKIFTIEEYLEKYKTSNKPLLILDGLKDPHNLGAIIRSADIFSCGAIIYKKDDSVSINATVEKISTGAINYVPIIEVVNLNKCIDKLKDNGYWIVGLDGTAKENIESIDHNMKTCLVLGSEGKGISRLVKENCDFLYKIPMSSHGNIDSLNASVAASICLYELNKIN